MAKPSKSARRRSNQGRFRPAKHQSSTAFNLPSWATSVVVHVCLFFMCAASLQSCSTGQPVGAVAEEYRDVGIYIKQPTPAHEIPQPAEPVQDPPQDNVPQEIPQENPQELPKEIPNEQTQQAPAEAVQIDAAPPAEIELPDTHMPVIGAGPPPVPPGQPTDVRQLIAPHSVRPPGGPAKLGNGETSFLDIRDKANRFCYLIDSSGSMAGPAMRYARSQLKSSLQQLNATQEFQVIFYNEHTRVMNLPPPARQTGKLYRATSTNISMASRFIDSVSPNIGTEHVVALRKALSFRPEVLFFLTDGTEPRLYAKDLDQIRKMNTGTRIHCIEFGKGPAINVVNWLKRLSDMNNGTYRYQNVNRLRR